MEEINLFQGNHMPFMEILFQSLISTFLVTHCIIFGDQCLFPCPIAQAIYYSNTQQATYSQITQLCLEVVT